MGVGLYLVWPAFYTEVSTVPPRPRRPAARRPRRSVLQRDLRPRDVRRVVLVRWDALLLVVAAQPLQMVRQLAPFVRFDGYHILADLVGVPDLFRHIRPTLPGCSRRAGAAPRPRRSSAWARAVVTLWVLVVVPLIVALLVVMVVALPRVVGTAWDSLGLQWELARGRVGTGRRGDGRGARRLDAMVVLPVSGIVYLLLRVGRRTASKTLCATSGRPLLRTGAALAAGALVTGLAWAWWPHGGEYRPIGPSERGRVADVPRPAHPAVSPAVADRPVARCPGGSAAPRRPRARAGGAARAGPAPPAVDAGLHPEARAGDPAPAGARGAAPGSRGPDGCRSGSRAVCRRAAARARLGAGSVRRWGRHPGRSARRAGRAGGVARLGLPVRPAARARPARQPGARRQHRRRHLDVRRGALARLGHRRRAGRRAEHRTPRRAAPAARRSRSRSRSSS